MFNTNTEAQERGQVGIGTLIVFIALVLVAAIAAGVLINTAGFLQSQAEATGQESTDQVSNNLKVVGTSVTSDGSSVQSINALVSLGAGSDPVDLSQVTIEYIGPGGAATLVAGSDAIGTADNQVIAPDAGGPAFGVEMASSGGDTSTTLVPDSAPVLTDSSQRLRIVIPHDGSASGTVLTTEPAPGQEVSLRLTTADGAQQSIDIAVPDPLSSGDTRV